jgi:hypothetical protein
MDKWMDGWIDRAMNKLSEQVIAIACTKRSERNVA